MKRRVAHSERAARDLRFAELAAVAGEFEAFRPAADVLSKVRAVPTIFPQFDRITKVGGLPIERFSLLHGPSTGGKALEENTPVLTPDGWFPIKQLQVGDRVIGQNGKPTRVTGVYPQGKKRLYEITFNDNSSIECCAEHLWFTTTKIEKQRGQSVRGPRPERRRIKTGVDGIGSVKSLADILEDFKPGDHEIPQVEPVLFCSREPLPVHPYLLGLILGDGMLRGSQVKFFKPERDVQESFISLLPGGDHALPIEGGIRINGGQLKRRLEALGVWGKRSWEKVIPEPFLTSSLADRLALLRGLFDTDGHVPRDRGAVEYTTTSEQLADQVADMARSLGAFVHVAEERQTRFTYLGKKKLGRVSYRLRVVMPKGTTPVTSKKHLARWRSELVLERRRVMMRIRRTRVARAVCIEVDAPDRLFVTKDHIVTHNTYWAIGLMLSFLMRNHMVYFLDAERTTPYPWLVKAMGDYSAHPYFRADKPRTYEQAVENVRHFTNKLRILRDKKKVPPNTSALIVVDSLRKLVPKGQFEQIMKEARSTGAKQDNVRNRGAQIKAMMHAAWLDELVPLLDETQTAMVAIAREMVDPNNTNPKAIKYGTNVKTAGGGAPFYDASLDMRSSKIGVYGKESGSGEDKKTIPYGDVHKLVITKSKVSGKEEYSASCLFHISNGALVPPGFDRGRDLLHVARTFDVISGTSWLKFGKSKWQGEHLTVKALTTDPELYNAVERECRKLFKLEDVRE